MTYRINGIAITNQPTSGHWIPKSSLGTDGNGHDVYPAFREFEMKWNLIEESDFYQLQDFFDTMLVTGTIVVELPQYKVNTYTFFAYSGCILHEPQVDTFFNQNRMSAVLVISSIRT